MDPACMMTSRQQNASAVALKKLILVNFQAPGDIVALTAAVRDLHRAYPKRFLTDVRTSCPELWEHNPYLTPIAPDDPDSTVIDCHYPLIQESNRRRIHFLNGFIEYLKQTLGLAFRLTRLSGDIHLSEPEKRQPSPVEQRTGINMPYWIITAGGKFDYTIKWWHFRRWQAVVDRFREKILFVQVGEKHHYHPRLSGVLDFRGLTPPRELLRLVYHAQGVICPVTFLMHLAAAVETKSGSGAARPCVVVAGGREPVAWEAYPGHEFLHTIGQLPCCATGGCWRSRSVPLGDGDEKDRPEHLCADTVEHLPRCMHLITPEHVAAAIQRYFDKLSLLSPTSGQWRRINRFLSRRPDQFLRRYLCRTNDRSESDSALQFKNAVNHQHQQTYA
jgi:ADP-heptose:LPS heptosyltransferase